MPLQKLRFRPGINRDGTDLSNQGGWWECDKIRFRSGLPERIGGWTRLTAEILDGAARNLINWTALDGANLLGVGTSHRYYIEYGTELYDITPVRATFTDTYGVATTDGSSVITLTITGHGVVDGGSGDEEHVDHVALSGFSSAIGGIAASDLNGTHNILSAPTANTVTVDVGVPASSTTSGNHAYTADFLLPPGAATASYSTGWGMGPWGRGGWGSGYQSTVIAQLRLWSHDTFGQDLVFCPRNGAIYYWSPGAATQTALVNRASPLTAVPSASEVPVVATCVLVTGDRHVVALGTNDIGTTTQDPLFIRWSDQEDYAEWAPAATNTAGGYRLDNGAYIVTAVKTRQENLIWTDAALFSMQFIGPPYTFGFHTLARNISIVSPNAVAVSGDMVFWMGRDKFYAYTGRVETLPSSLWEHVFNNFNFAQRFQTFAGTIEKHSEIWWFYCSKDSNTVDRYVVYNYVERVWYYGTMFRTAWLDSPIRSNPMGAMGETLLFHESGQDDSSTGVPVPIESYISSSDFDIGEGDKYALIRRIIPDITFLNSTSGAPSVDMEVQVRRFPGTNYHEKVPSEVVRSATFPVEQFGTQYHIRLRGRQIALKISSADLGVMWQLGVPRLDFQPDGKR